jgi:hypothetical protein
MSGLEGIANIVEKAGDGLAKIFSALSEKL